MDRESVERLRYDIRLKRRREWVSPEDRQANIDSLPDLTDKMIRGFEDEDEIAADGADAGSAAEQSTSSHSPDPVAPPTFGSSPTHGQDSPQTPPASQTPPAPSTPPTPIPFGSSASPSSDFSNDGGEGGSGFS